MNEEKIQEIEKELSKMTKEELKVLARKYLISKEKTRLRKAKHYESKKGAN